MTYPQWIYDTLRDRGPLTARQLSATIDLHPDTISSFLTRLRRRGIIEPAGHAPAERTGGPRPTRYQVIDQATRPNGSARVTLRAAPSRLRRHECLPSTPDLPEAIIEAIIRRSHAAKRPGWKAA